MAVVLAARCPVVIRRNPATYVATTLIFFTSLTVSGYPPNQKHVSSPSPYEPTNRYELRRIEGWSVLINKRFLAEEPKLAEETLTLLRNELYQIARRVPATATKKLQTIRFWVEEQEPHTPCMTYHADARWLRADNTASRCFC